MTQQHFSQAGMPRPSRLSGRSTGDVGTRVTSRVFTAPRWPLVSGHMMI